MDEKMKAVELKALAAIEKHAEALAVELVDIGKEGGDIAIEQASPLLKIIYGSTKENLADMLKIFIAKLDLDHDGK